MDAPDQGAEHCRSALAAEYATAAGLDELELFNVEGGTDAWAEAGLPTGD